MPKKNVLITGASGGIGLELARVFAREGHDLWLVARNGAKLEQIREELAAKYSISAHTLPKDLSSLTAAKEIFNELQERSVFIDILVNNAGVGSFGPFASTDLSQHENLMVLNMVSLTQLTKLFLTPMVERKEGRILNVASTAAFQPGPLMAVYYATKAYVLHLSEALSVELEGSGVTVTALCPGPTDTGFKDCAHMGSSKLFKSAVMDAKSVAEIGYRGLMRGKTVVIPGLKNKILANSSRFAPRKLTAHVVKMVQEKDKSGR